MIIYENKRDRYAWHIVPIAQGTNLSEYPENSYVYFLDGKKHGKIPAVVLSTLTDIYGGISKIKKAGYSEHWSIFEDLDTGKFYFGNYPSFSRSSEAEDRERAKAMPEVDINRIGVILCKK